MFREFAHFIMIFLVISSFASAYVDEIGIFGDYFFNEEFNTLLPKSRYIIDMPGATSLRKGQIWLSQEYAYWQVKNLDYSQLIFRSAYGVSDFFEVEGGYMRGEGLKDDGSFGRIRFTAQNHKHATAFGFMATRENSMNSENEPTIFTAFGSKMFYPNYSLHLSMSKADRGDNRILWQLGTELEITSAFNIMATISRLERERNSKYDIGGRYLFGEKAYFFLNRTDLSTDFFQKSYDFGISVFL